MSEIYPIAVPKWGIEMVEGTITTWNKSEGDTVAKGDEVFEMESDKIVNVWDSPVAGVLRRVIAAAGDAHPVGALLGIIADASVADGDIDQFIAEHRAVAPESAPDTPAAQPAEQQSTPNRGCLISSLLNITLVAPRLLPLQPRQQRPNRQYKPETRIHAPPPASVALPMSWA